MDAFGLLSALPTAPAGTGWDQILVLLAGGGGIGVILVKALLGRWERADKEREVRMQSALDAATAANTEATKQSGEYLNFVKSELEASRRFQSTIATHISESTTAMREVGSLLRETKDEMARATKTNREAIAAAKRGGNCKFKPSV